MKCEAICDSADKYVDEPPLEALTGWLREFVGFAATKRALAEELFDYIDRDSPVFSSCVTAIYGAGEDLLKRAQDAGEVRADADISDVTKMVSGIAGIRTADRRADRPHPRPRTGWAAGQPQLLVFTAAPASWHIRVWIGDAARPTIVETSE